MNLSGGCWHSEIDIYDVAVKESQEISAEKVGCTDKTSCNKTLILLQTILLQKIYYYNTIVSNSNSPHTS